MNPSPGRFDRNWFEHGGADYARYRPGYPDALVAALAASAPGTGRAVDVGCGTGQLTARLAPEFDEVIGVDPSAEQLINATDAEGVRYLCAPAERLPIAEETTDLITVAQAAHWFELDAFYREAHRIAVEDGVLALISYGVVELEGEVGERFRQFYDTEIGPFWPPERRHVESGYADLPFPFRRIPVPPTEMSAEWSLARLLGYIATWSATRRAAEAGHGDRLTHFAAALTDLWGDPALPRSVRWPLTVLAGIAK